MRDERCAVCGSKIAGDACPKCGPVVTVRPVASGSKVATVAAPAPGFFGALEASGMRHTECEDCGCEMYTRGTEDRCPPCRDMRRAIQ